MHNLFNKIKKVIRNKKGVFVATGMRIVIAVVVGALLLGSCVAITNTVMSGTDGKVSSIFSIADTALEGGTIGGTGMGGSVIPDIDEPEQGITEFTVYGRTVQDNGTPALDNMVPIKTLSNPTITAYNANGKIIKTATLNRELNGINNYKDIVQIATEEFTDSDGNTVKAGEWYLTKNIYHINYSDASEFSAAKIDQNTAGAYRISVYNTELQNAPAEGYNVGLCNIIDYNKSIVSEGYDLITSDTGCYRSDMGGTYNGLVFYTTKVTTGSNFKTYFTNNNLTLDLYYQLQNPSTHKLNEAEQEALNGLITCKASEIKVSSPTGISGELDADYSKYSTINNSYVKDGLFIVNPENYSSYIASYNTFDLGNGNIPNKFMTRTKWTSGTDSGSVTLISNKNGPLPTDITKKSVHINFSSSNVRVGLFEEHAETVALNYQYSPTCKRNGTNSYEMGWEINGDTITLYCPDGTEQSVTINNLSDYMGQYACVEHFANNAEQSLPMIEEFSIYVDGNKTVYDTFTNKPNGEVLVTDSGHNYIRYNVVDKELY